MKYFFYVNLVNVKNIIMAITIAPKKIIDILLPDLNISLNFTLSINLTNKRDNRKPNTVDINIINGLFIITSPLYYLKYIEF